MKTKTSLTVKLLAGFILVTSLLITLLLFNNVYSMHVVREEVSESNHNLLQSHGKLMERTLGEIRAYLYWLVSNDTSSMDMQTLSRYRSDSGDYFFAMQRLHESFRDNMSTLSNVETFFTWDIRIDDKLVVSRGYRSKERSQIMLQEYADLFTGDNVGKWHHVKADGSSYLLLFISINPERFVGVFVSVDSMLEPLRGIRFGDKGEPALIYGGMELLNYQYKDPGESDAWQAALAGGDDFGEANRTIRTSSGSYLFIRYPFQGLDVDLAVLIPEGELLQRLPFFQKAGYWIPVAGLFLFGVYYLFLKKVFQKPMTDLIGGMRRISRGDIQVRLEESGGASRELAFLIDTFNMMASEIQHLKIGVYEETLKTQQAEFKHLQAQIKPHFYLNSLNIIYSLSVLGENALVQKMTEHLAEYFRFIMRSNRETILLSEEMEHIRNYLEIQQLRFFRKLSYRIDVPDTLGSIPVIPLTIQPFVENAIIHGMNQPDGNFEVVVEAALSEEDSNYLTVTISDNGRGFPEAELQGLQTGSFADGDGLDHLGIWNVHRRLRLQYGKAVGLRFANREDGGATVILSVPLLPDS